MEMEMEGGNGEVRVPPGFRFHPTDEELLYYYLKKKISYQPIDLDVIREVDLNRLEPWEIREKCRIGTGPQNEWYLFSHKDKKYPTGTRTNRATTAGFWKATGRDKAIFLTNIGKRIGMRKTLVFYVGRAPHGQKTDWIMHEYRLDDIESTDIQQEDGWVVCRVFKKKNHTTTAGFQAAPVDAIEDQEACQEEFLSRHTRSSIGNSGSSSNNHFMPKRSFQQQSVYSYSPFEGSMDLPHLSSPDSSIPPPTATFLAPMSLNTGDLECSQNLLRLTSGGPAFTQQASEHQKLSGDWFFLDKLLTNYHTLDQHNKSSHHQPQPHVTLQINAVDMDSSTNHHQKFPFQYLGCEQDVLKYSTR